MTDVYLANSHSWVYERLLERPRLERRDVNLVESRRGADLILFTQPPRPEPDARDPLRSFGPRERLRLFVYAQMDDPFPWAPGVYAGLPAGWASRGTVGGFYVAHHHRDGGLAEDIEEAGAERPDLLWSFMGTVANDPVRRSIAAVEDDRGLVQDTQAWNDGVRWNWSSTQRREGRQAFERFAALLGRSKFVLCPRGRSPSSIRLFEVLQAGRCPVILSDEWLPPPFVDWDACSIRVPEAAAAELPRLLRAREGAAAALGRRAREEWERHYAPERQLETLISSCLTIEDSLATRAGVLGRALARPDAPRRAGRRLKARLRS